MKFQEKNETLFLGVFALLYFHSKMKYCQGLFEDCVPNFHEIGRTDYMYIGPSSPFIPTNTYMYMPTPTAKK